VSIFERVSGLPLVVEEYDLERLEQPISADFTRVTTQMRLRGGGEEGVGEDVTYDAEEHDRLHAAPPLELAGDWTVGTFSHHLDGLELFAEPPAMDAYLDYRRWGFESAALDLALRQAGHSLAYAVGRPTQPVRFVVSLRLGEPSSLDPIEQLLEEYPGTRLKLDPVPDWTDELIAGLAALDAVDVVDLKGAYQGTVVDNPPNPELYTRVAEAFASAWIEDPALTPETDDVLRQHRDRITWDAPIHSVADIEARSFPPRTINIKPSRFGSIERLFAAYDYCADRSIGMYGGGQFELGVGRGHIQHLASLFHAGSSNDVAPGGYNLTPPLPPGLAVSPLEPAPAATGLRWG